MILEKSQLLKSHKTLKLTAKRFNELFHPSYFFLQTAIREQSQAKEFSQRKFSSSTLSAEFPFENRIRAIFYNHHCCHQSCSVEVIKLQIESFGKFLLNFFASSF